MVRNDTLSSLQEALHRNAKFLLINGVCLIDRLREGRQAKHVILGRIRQATARQATDHLICAWQKLWHRAAGIDEEKGSVRQVCSFRSGDYERRPC